MYMASDRARNEQVQYVGERSKRNSQVSGDDARLAVSKVASILSAETSSDYDCISKLNIHDS